jgi:acetyl esterase/lipase
VNVAVLIHGGFWRTPYGPDLMAPLAHDLKARGWQPVCLSYRRLGEAGGGWPGTFDDVRDAVAELHDVGADRIAVIGHSAGGHLALWLAAQGVWPLGRPPAVAVALAGVVDLAEADRLGLSGGAAAELVAGDRSRFARASPRERLPLGVRQLLVHGAEDDTVPAAMSEAYAAAARQAGDEVELVVVPGEGHFAPIDPASRCWAEVAARL